MSRMEKIAAAANSAAKLVNCPAILAAIAAIADSAEKREWRKK